jgi:hypothetical protein
MSKKQMWAVALGVGALVTGCGAAPPPPPVPPAAAPQVQPSEAPAAAAASTIQATESEEPALAKTRDVPQKCDDAKNCYLPGAFVEAVCKKKYPDLPLTLFAGRMPWQHLYVKAEYVEPVNPHGGEQNEMWMKFGEEVVVLRKRAPASGKSVQTSGPSDVDVLRWDGTCATIREEMLVSYVPAPMQSPRIIFKYLDGALQEALLKNQVVARARDGEKKSCRDSSAKHPTPACEKAMQKLTDAIALAVHQNVALPNAGNVPEWIP